MSVRARSRVSEHLQATFSAVSCLTWMLYTHRTSTHQVPMAADTMALAASMHVSPVNSSKVDASALRERTGGRTLISTSSSSSSVTALAIDSDDDDDAHEMIMTRDRRSSSVESALSLVGDDFTHSSGMMGGCCRGYSARLLFLMGCAMIEYVAHTVVLVLGPMIALHFYPTTSYPRIGFYTAILSGAGYLGSMLSCRLWINMAKSLKSAKGVILWGLAILGTGFFSLLLCQSLLAMAIVRFAMGLFSGVLPVALMEIDNICGNRQTRLATATKYMGIVVGAGATLLLVGLGDRLFSIAALDHDDSSLYFYPFGFVSILAWIAVMVTMIGLRMQSRAAYVPLVSESDPRHRKQRRSALDESPTGASSTSTAATSSSLTKVKAAFEETFRRSTRHARKQLLNEPRPHFRTVRGILPHFFHGYTDDGDVVVWDFLGQIKMDRLASAGFTTLDIKAHYQFFVQFALENLVKSSGRKIVYVVDLEGLTLTDADDRVVESAGVIIEELQRSFPDTLAHLAVINAPVWFSQVMAGVKHKIAKRTLDKIHFFPAASVDNDLRKLLGVDSLPKRYGGRNGVEFGKSSQERALSDHLRQTTGLLEETKEIIRGGGAGVRRGHAGSIRSDGDSDEEAFFDCSEYGLQDAYDDDDDEISIVVHSQLQSQQTELVARGSPSPTKPATTSAASNSRSQPDKKAHDMETGTTIAEAKRKSQSQTLSSSSSSASDTNAAELAITREPHACLILAVFFIWSLVQIAFDEILPLWFFRKHPTVKDTGIHAAQDPVDMTISSITLHLAISLTSMAFTYLCGHLFLCRSSSSVMTPLATLRVGLLFQIPVVAAFPLLNVFHLDTLPFASALVVVLVLLKHVTGVIAFHGFMALLDNSIAVDRRLIAHRAAHFVSYVASLLSAGGSPALFALLGYFAKAFPLDPSLLYFVQALGLGFLFLFSFLIPNRLNFPMLFAMNKR